MSERDIDFDFDFDFDFDLELIGERNNPYHTTKVVLFFIRVK